MGFLTMFRVCCLAFSNLNLMTFYWPQCHDFGSDSSITLRFAACQGVLLVWLWIIVAALIKKWIITQISGPTDLENTDWLAIVPHHPSLPSPSLFVYILPPPSCPSVSRLPISPFYSSAPTFNQDEAVWATLVMHTLCRQICALTRCVHWRSLIKATVEQ